MAGIKAVGQLMAQIKMPAASGISGEHKPASSYTATSASLGGCDARRRDTVMDEGEKHTTVCMGESCEEEGSGQTVNPHRASLLCFGHKRKRKALVFLEALPKASELGFVLWEVKY